MSGFLNSAMGDLIAELDVKMKRDRARIVDLTDVMSSRQAELRRFNRKSPVVMSHRQFLPERQNCLGDFPSRSFSDPEKTDHAQQNWPEKPKWKTCGPAKPERAKYLDSRKKMSQSDFHRVIRRAKASEHFRKEDETEQKEQKERGLREAKRAREREVEEAKLSVKNSEMWLVRQVLEDVFKWEDRPGHRLCFGFGSKYSACVKKCVGPEELRLRVIRGTVQELEIQRFLEFDEVGPYIVVQLGDKGDPNRRYRVSVIYADRALRVTPGPRFSVKREKLKGLPRWPIPPGDNVGFFGFLHFLILFFATDLVFKYRNRRNLAISRNEKFQVYDEIEPQKALPAPRNEPRKLPGAVVSG